MLALSNVFTVLYGRVLKLFVEMINFALSLMLKYLLFRSSWEGRGTGKKYMLSNANSGGGRARREKTSQRRA